MSDREVRLCEKIAKLVGVEAKNGKYPRLAQEVKQLVEDREALIEMYSAVLKELKFLRNLVADGVK